MSVVSRGLLALACLASLSGESGAQTGRIVVDTVRSASLANRIGRPAETRVSVYLPPSYDRAPSARYPVVYLLHGFDANDVGWIRPGPLVGVAGIMDGLIASGKAKDMIVVMPNGSTPLGGSFYVNSAASGNWEDFIARDLIAWTDKRFRTIPRAESRGIAGHSMGGFGTLYLGMRHGGETYGALYAMSPCCTVPASFDSTRDSPVWDALGTATSIDGWQRKPFPLRATAAISQAFAPDTTRAPLYFSPLEVRRNGRWEQNPEVARQFDEHTPVLMIPRYRANLAAMRGVQLDIGEQDNMVDPRDAMRVDTALTKAGVPHVFQLFQGDHVNRIGARLENAVFPFFSRVLVFESRTQTPPHYRYRVLGAFDEATGQPIEDVEVSDILSGASSLTSVTGTVSLFFLPDSGSLVRLRKVGYEMQTLAVAITPADTAPVTVVLRKAVVLPTMTVMDSTPSYRSGRLRGAEERVKARAGGYFIDEAQMRKWDSSTLANALIARAPGLMPTPGAHGETYFVSSRKMCKQAFQCSTRPDCYISVYIDGVLSAVRPDFSRMSTIDYAIAEFYPSAPSEPVEYPGPCGSLLLWSRES
ncbi:MAG: esterase [Gemmatimonadetes bacterium]|nr:esterase [Gemmatimonadota bacterium]